MMEKRDWFMLMMWIMIMIAYFIKAYDWMAIGMFFTISNQLNEIYLKARK